MGSCVTPACLHRINSRSTWTISGYRMWNKLWHTRTIVNPAIDTLYHFGAECHSTLCTAFLSGQGRLLQPRHLPDFPPLHSTSKLTNAISAATVKWGFFGGHGFGDRSKIRNLYSTIKIPQTVAAQWLYPVAFRDSLDWKDYDAPTIYQRVTSKVCPGSIVLFHNAALHTPEALPDILEYLINDGYTIVPISELILDGDYIMDHTGRQCPAGQQ